MSEKKWHQHTPESPSRLKKLRIFLFPPHEKIDDAKGVELKQKNLFGGYVEQSTPSVYYRQSPDTPRSKLRNRYLRKERRLKNCIVASQLFFFLFLIACFITLIVYFSV